ncbi:hypothetical protein CALVIDRAFT_540613 [Calocera viscosa TUFC12733]|uniref:Uncharacterized protein n=1 Tax=Calocera viscosa (strain TUFC12733) TaxID=1330018 RepID=A0A167IKE3_CALVF|nr:hypothetical protein CALVIDRAFT_540613 [Calocera viscosa TUFC12733]
MSLNLDHVLRSVASTLDSPSNAQLPHPVSKSPIPHAPCLPARLPNEAFLQREGDLSGPRAILAQLRRSPSPSELQEALETPLSPNLHRRGTKADDAKGKKAKHRKPQKPPGWKEPQPFEIFRAVERKDVMFLMQVRDHAFHLLLKKTGDATPLVHAMRIGKSHRDVAIILLGAMSRWVNHLDDDEIELPATKMMLKALRTNLKLAIDHGLASSQNDLIPSFMQCLVMSEGDRWVRAETEMISLALRQGTEGHPVTTAEAAVRAFATRELGKAEFIAALEEYVANATSDLIMLGIWYQLSEADPNADVIPAYYFARDDRIYRAWEERIQAAKLSKATKRLRWQIRVVHNVMEGRNSSYRQKVEVLKGELDDGPGV